MRKKIILFLNLFFIALAGLEHSLEVFIHNLYFNSLCFYLANLIFLLGIALWYFTMKYRILDKKMTKGFFMISVCLFLLIALKVLKYRVVSSNAAARYLDYFYYVFMGLAATEFLVLTSYLAKPVGYQPSWRIYLVYVIPAMISLMILTNDLHQFNYKVLEDGTLKFAAGQWIVMGSLGAELLASFIVTVKKCSVPAFRKKLYIPGLCFLFTVAGYLLAYVLPDVRFPFSFPDFTVIALITYVESFIYTGLIRSNENYKEFFKSSGLNAFLTDTEYNLVCSSINSGSYSREELKEASDGFLVRNDVRLGCEKLRSSLFYYEESLEKIHDMNRKLSDVLVSIDEENEIIEEEQRVGREKLRLKEKLDLLTEITDIIIPSVDRIHYLLKDINEDSADYEGKVAEACFILSYVKRRINLTLLSRMGGISNREMEFALNEIISTYKLTGKEVSYLLDSRRSPDNILDSFDYCYKILYENLEKSEASFITFARDSLKIQTDMEEKTYVFTYPETGGEEA